MLGFVYVDGHVQGCFAKRRIFKSHVRQRRLAMPAVSDYWVSDVCGEPPLVVTGNASASLTGRRMLILEEECGRSPKPSVVRSSSTATIGV